MHDVEEVKHPLNESFSGKPKARPENLWAAHANASFSSRRFRDSRLKAENDSRMGQSSKSYLHSNCSGDFPSPEPLNTCFFG
jgi:hypothetical protein